MKIKANELRLGNLVGIKETALHSDGCNINDVCFEVSEIKSDVVFFKDFHAGEYYKDLKPIHLTEEWLVKFGLKKDANGNYWIYLHTHYLDLIQSGEYYYSIYTEIPELSTEKENNASLNRIEHVQVKN